MNEKFASIPTLFFYPEKARKNLPQIFTKNCNYNLQQNNLGIYNFLSTALSFTITNHSYTSSPKNHNKKEKKSEFFSFIHPINHAPLSKNDHQHAYKSESSESMNAQAKSAPT